MPPLVIYNAYINPYLVSNYETFYLVSIVETMFGSSLYSSEYDTLRLWLKNARNSSGLTIREVALKLGVHHSVVGKIETGHRKLELFEFLTYCEAISANVEEGFSIAVKASARG